MSNDDADKITGPAGLTIRQIHEQVKKSMARDRAAQKPGNPLQEQKSRWQRFARYAWGRSGKR